MAINISQASSAQDSNNRLVSDGGLHLASWYEHFVSAVVHVFSYLLLQIRYRITLSYRTRSSVFNIALSHLD